MSKESEESEESEEEEETEKAKKIVPNHVGKTQVWQVDLILELSADVR